MAALVGAAVAAEALTMTDLAVVLTVAAVALLIVRRLRQPMVLGYLVAGLLVGPFGPSPFHPVSHGSVETLAALGVVFIMVGLGLEFNPKKLRRLGAAPVGVGLVQILFSYGVARLVAHYAGFTDLEAIFIGAALAISSTIVAVKFLEERHALDSPSGRMAIGVLLVQDIVAVVFLGLVEGLSVTGELGLSGATPIVFGILAFTVAALVLGALFVPRLLNEAAGGPRELLLVVILGLVMAVTLFADHFGFSGALGAFLVGAIIAETKVVHTAERLVEPLKHMFTAVFFVSIGMLIDPVEIFEQWRSVLVFSAVVILTRFIGVALPAFLFGSRPKDALSAGATLGQIGEFSFIVISSGAALGLVPPGLFVIFVGVAAVTTLTTPYFMKLSPLALRGAAQLTPAPLLTYAQYYTGWVQRLGESEETKRHRRKELILFRRLMLNMVGLLVIAALMWLANAVLSETLIGIGTFSIPAVWAIWPLVGLVSIPFLLIIWSSLRALAFEVVYELVPDRVAHMAEPPIALKVVRASLGLVLALAVGALSLILLPSAGFGGTLLVPVVILLVFLAGAIFWRRIQHMHAHVEGTIENLFGVSKTAAERDEVLRLIGRHYTVSLETETIIIPEGSPLAHRQIRDAQIRNRSGATIVSVERGRNRYVNPPASLLLLPGDRVLVMGEAQHVRKARVLLERREAPKAASPAASLVSTREPIAVREVRLADDAYAEGQSIAALGLRAITGASLVAAIRGADHVQNPTPNFILKGGDRLFLIGTIAQLEGAEAMLRRKRTAADEAAHKVVTGADHPDGFLDDDGFTVRVDSVDEDDDEDEPFLPT